MKKWLLCAILTWAIFIPYIFVNVFADVPTVKTSWYEDLTRTTCTWVGELQFNGGYNVTDVGFMYGTSRTNLSTKKSYGYMGGTKGTYRVYVTGLNTRTKYYFEAYAVNQDGTSYGSILEILTPDVPDITTVSATNITKNSVTLTGNLTANNSSSVYDCGFIYGIGSSLNQSISYGSMGDSKGTIIKTVTGLQPNTTYSYRAYADNDIGQGLGTIRTFTTAKSMLTAPTTYNVSGTNVKKTDATIKWYAVSNATGYKISLRNLDTQLSIMSQTLSESTRSYNLSSYLDYNTRYRVAITGTNPNYEDNWTEVEFSTKPDEMTITGLSTFFSCYQGESVTLNGTLAGNTNITKVTINVYNEDDVIASETLNLSSVNLSRYTINTSQGIFAQKTGTYTINIWATSVGQPTGTLVGSTTLEVKYPILSAPIVTNLTENMEVEKGAFTVSWNSVSNATGYLIALRDTTTWDQILSNISVSGTSYTIGTSNLQYDHSYRFAITAVREGFDSEWTEINFKVKPDTPRISGLSALYTVVQGQIVSLTGTVTANTNITKVTAGILNLSDSFVSVTPNTTSYSLSNIFINTNSGVLAGRYGDFTVNIWSTSDGCTNAAKIGTFTLRIKNIQLDAPRFTNISNGASYDKSDLTVNWAAVPDATGYELTLRNTDSGRTVFTKSLTSTSYQIASSQLERGGKYQLTLKANATGRTSNSTSINFSVTLNGIIADSSVAKVAPNIFEFTLTSDYHAPKVVVQFKLSDGSWMTVNDIISDSRFLLDYQGKSTSGEYTYFKRFNISSAGNRTLRFLLLDHDNNVIYTVTRQHNISVDSLLTVTKSGDNDFGYVHISYADDSISSVKILINGTEVAHYSRTNGNFNDYAIDKHQYDDGIYSIEVWGCEYQTYRVLSVASPGTFTVDNPVVIIDIQPVKLTRDQKRIHITGTNLERVSLALYVNGNPASDIFGSGANNLTIIQQNSYDTVIADIPAAFDSANEEYKIDVRATYNGKEWIHPFWIEKRTPDVTITGAEEAYKRALQIHDFQWTPLHNIRGWKNRTTFYAGTTYTGIPYGQPVAGSNSAERYVPNALGFSGFKEAVENGNSVFYTNYTGYASAICPIYSNDCSAFVSWAWGLNRLTTTGFDGRYSNLGSNASNLQAGDALNSAGHIILVYRVERDGSGSITRVYTIEQTPPKPIKRSFTLSEIQSKINSGGYHIIRNPKLDSVQYNADANAPINYDEPGTLSMLSVPLDDYDITLYDEYDDDNGEQNIVVDGEILSVLTRHDNNSVEITLDKPITQIFPTDSNLVTIIKNGDQNIELQQNDYMTFNGNTISIYLADGHFFDDCESIQVVFPEFSIALAGSYNTVEIASTNIDLSEEDDTQLPINDAEFQYVNLIRSANSVRVLFNKTLQSIDISLIQLLNSENANITLQYPFTALMNGNEIEISFQTLPIEEFTVRIAPNAVTAVSGEVLTEELITEAVTFDPSMISDDGFEDDSTDLTETLRISDLALIKEQIWEDMTASLKVSIANGTESSYDSATILVGMYDTETGRLLSINKAETAIEPYGEISVFLDLPLNVNMNADGKYNEGGYYFKAFLWRDAETAEPFVNIPAILYVGGGN